MGEAAVQFKDKKLRNFLRKMQKKVKDYEDGAKSVIAAWGPLVFADVIDHFEKQKGPKGKWEQWSKSYQKRMAKMKKGGNKILIDSGRLRNSFQPSNARSIKDGILWFNPAKTANGFPYAKAHDEGGKKLPQREFMYLSQDAMGKIAALTLKDILR